MKARIKDPMKLPSDVPDRTLHYLRRMIPRGYAESEDLLNLIRFYEKASADARKHRK